MDKVVSCSIKGYFFFIWFSAPVCARMHRGCFCFYGVFGQEHTRERNAKSAKPCASFSPQAIPEKSVTHPRSHRNEEKSRKIAPFIHPHPSSRLAKPKKSTGFLTKSGAFYVVPFLKLCIIHSTISVSCPQNILFQNIFRLVSSA